MSSTSTAISGRPFSIGSIRDPSGAVAGHAQRTGEGYRINGEKWFVTSANLADYFFLQAKLSNGPHAGSDALFFIDKGTPGMSVSKLEDKLGIRASDTAAIVPSVEQAREAGLLVIALAWFLAALVAQSRVLLGIHSVTEIVAGSLIGIGTTVVMHLAF